MAIIKVTATLTYEYDTDDGVATTVEEAVNDMGDMLMSGDVGLGEYTVTTEVL